MEMAPSTLVVYDIQSTFYFISDGFLQVCLSSETLFALQSQHKSTKTPKQPIFSSEHRID